MYGGLSVYPLTASRCRRQSPGSPDRSQYLSAGLLAENSAEESEFESGHWQKLSFVTLG